MESGGQGGGARHAAQRGGSAGSGVCPPCALQRTPRKAPTLPNIKCVHSTQARATASSLERLCCRFEEWGPKVAQGELLDREKETVVLCQQGIRCAPAQRPGRRCPGSVLLRPGCGPRSTAPSLPLPLSRLSLVLCLRSLQFSKWLVTQGFTNVRSVTGGITAYSLAVDPSIPQY